MAIPDSINPDTLQSLFDAAIQESKEQAKDSGPYGGYSQEAMLNIVSDAKDELLEKVSHPMAHKMMVLMIIQHFIDWHGNIAIDNVRAGHESSTVRQMTCGLGWAEDIGKLKAAYEIFRSVSLGDEDFTCESEDE